MVVNFKLSSEWVIVGKHVRKPETETCQCYRIVESSTGISLATCEGLKFRGFMLSVVTQTLHCVHTVYLCAPCVCYNAVVYLFYSIHRLALLMEAHCVLCAVRTDYLYCTCILIIKWRFFLHGTK